MAVLHATCTSGPWHRCSHVMLTVILTYSLVLDSSLQIFKEKRDCSGPNINVAYIQLSVILYNQSELNVATAGVAS